MLVLSRKAGQTIEIGPNIKLTVVKVHGDKVMLGLDAPADVTILRGELAEIVTDGQTSETAGVAHAQ